MKTGSGTAWIMLVIMVSFLMGTVAAAGFFTGGSYISTGTSVSVRGSVNETITIKRNSIGSGTEKTEWIASYNGVNPAGLTWNSQMSLGTANGTVLLNYFRSAGSPLSPWRQVPGR